MMTTMAALFGAVPLALGTGAGAELRVPLGIAIIGGLIASQVLTLYATPVIYLWFDQLAASVRGWRKEIRPAQTEPGAHAAPATVDLKSTPLSVTP